jgi:uncharacterized HAD superfamily protein
MTFSVVLDFVGGLRAALKKEYDVDLKEEDISDFDLKPILNPIIGRSWWAWMKERSWIWSHFPPVDGAIGTLDRLRRDGHYIELVTSKPEWAEHNVYRWLGKWRPPFQRVTITGPSDVKAAFTEADILIDDKYENVRDFAASGRTALLFDRPHNRGVVPPAGVTRVHGWREVYEHIGGKVK